MNNDDIILRSKKEYSFVHRDKDSMTNGIFFIFVFLIDEGWVGEEEFRSQRYTESPKIICKSLDDKIS